MPLKIRTYRELTEPDRSGLPEQVGAQRHRVSERLSQVRRVVAVLSGKGGVGKSFVAARVAAAAATAGRAVGLLDADLEGPTAARLLGSRDARLRLDGDSVLPVVSAHGVKLVSMDHVIRDGGPLAFKGPERDAFVWRGAAEAAALRELLGDVAWGALDVLLVDLPPGLERFNELADLLSAPPTVVIVTIPTVESLDAVRRAVRAVVERGTTPLGIVENMVGGPFEGDAADALSREFGVPVLARVPFHPADPVWAELVARL